MPTTERLAKLKRAASLRQKDVVLVIEDIHDPHNAQAIMRTADAFGIQNVHFIFETEKRYNPKRVGKSSSSSAMKWLDYTIWNSTKECLTSLKKQKFHLVGTALTDTSVSLQRVTFKAPKIALLVGNEHHGLSEEALKRADQLITIPMRGMVQSLNVSVATAIVIAELTRQRTKIKNKSLTKKEQDALIASWVDR